jgi:hypothetical protein
MVLPRDLGTGQLRTGRAAPAAPADGGSGLTLTFGLVVLEGDGRRPTEPDTQKVSLTDASSTTMVASGPWQPQRQAVERNEPEIGHPHEVLVQRPEGALVVCSDGCNEEVRDAESLAGVARLIDPGIDPIPGPLVRVENGKGGKEPPEAPAVLAGRAREEFHTDGCRQGNLVGVEQASEMSSLGSSGAVEGRDPHGGVDADHVRRRGRRRDDGTSTSRRMEPSRLLSSSTRRRRISSRSDTTTVSVLDLKPSSRRASSMSSAGISSVVRICWSLDRMLEDVNDRAYAMPATQSRSPVPMALALDRWPRPPALRPQRPSPPGLDSLSDPGLDSGRVHTQTVGPSARW